MRALLLWQLSTALRGLRTEKLFWSLDPHPAPETDAWLRLSEYRS